MTISLEKPVLYSFRRCPYAMRARMAIAYSQTEVELREVVLRDKPVAMLAHSPKGTVPVLILNDTRVLKDENLLEESLDIMHWALAQSDPEDWLPTSNILNSEMATLIQSCDGEFKTHLDHYKYADRFPERSMTEYRTRGEDFLKRLNQMLSTQPYLYGQRVSYADIAIFPFVRQFAHVDKTWFDQTEYMHLKKWLAQHLASEIFLNIMQKFPQWKEGDLPTLFPASIHAQ